MIIVAAFLLVVASVPLRGGDLRRLADLRVEAVWLALASLLLQIAIIDVLESSVPISILAIVHLASYLFAFGFLWANRRMPGLPFVVAGGAANLVAVAANGGSMPSTHWALELAGKQPANSVKFTNSGVVEHARLVFLGDIFPWPKPLPLANVFSIGDVLLVIGAALILHRAAVGPVATTPTDDGPLPSIAGEAGEAGDATRSVGAGAHGEGPHALLTAFERRELVLGILAKTTTTAEAAAAAGVDEEQVTDWCEVGLEAMWRALAEPDRQRSGRQRVRA